MAYNYKRKVFTIAWKGWHGSRNLAETFLGAGIWLRTFLFPHVKGRTEGRRRE